MKPSGSSIDSSEIVYHSTYHTKRDHLLSLLFSRRHTSHRRRCFEEGAHPFYFILLLIVPLSCILERFDWLSTWSGGLRFRVSVSDLNHSIRSSWPCLWLSTAAGLARDSNQNL